MPALAVQRAGGVTSGISPTLGACACGRYRVNDLVTRRLSWPWPPMVPAGARASCPYSNRTLAVEVMRPSSGSAAAMTASAPSSPPPIMRK
jgi:hypothetical protein